jgi:AbrB family looped-hinge helix DNA binding protein
MIIMGKMGRRNMPLAKMDERGRVQLPSRLRQKMKLKEGDEFVAEDLGEDTIVLKKINLRALLEDAIVRAKSVDLDKLEREIEEESNQLARQKFKISAR